MIPPKKSFISRLKNIFLIVLLIVIYIWAFAGINFHGLQPMAKQIASAVLEGFTHPEWEFVSSPLNRFLNSMFDAKIPEQYLTSDGEDLLAQIMQTLAIAFLGTILSSILAIPFAFLAARSDKDKSNFSLKLKILGYSAIFFVFAILISFFTNGGKFQQWPKFWLWLFIIEAILILFDSLINRLMKKSVFDTKSYFGKFVLTIIRVFPEIILALMFVKAVGPGSFAGVLALAVHSIGMLGKLYSEAIENLEKGPNEALTAAGGDDIEILTFATFPEVLPSFLNAALYRFEIAVRSASILGMVGAGGIGQNLIFAISTRNWSRLGIIMIGIVLMVTAIDFISGQLRKRIV
ncbi:MAG: phosphate/phosphonate ABC transporter permease [Lactobacillaceae bacterium]|jgi:phosphonate transport system permease protein|nr:phosphate/phosphonate ABC transporter permease [Lactobacillaceae bacterium]